MVSIAIEVGFCFFFHEMQSSLLLGVPQMTSIFNIMAELLLVILFFIFFSESKKVNQSKRGEPALPRCEAHLLLTTSVRQPAMPKHMATCRAT